MRIQRVATGLLDFLNLRSQGETPDELARVVRPSIELTDFYDLSKHESVQEPVSLNTGQIEFLQVPDDEVWKLLALGITRDPAAIAAGYQTAFTFSIENLIGAGLNGVPFHTSPRLEHPTTALLTPVLAYAHLLEKPFLVRAGQRITVTAQYVLDGGGASFNWTGDFWLHIVRMKT